MNGKKLMTDYWICSKCAEKKKWMPPEGIVTASEGICFYCKGENQKKNESLIPIRDYTIPGDRSWKVWD